jgi:acyl-CoA hydrolase
MVKDKATGERVETSKIVPLLKQGAAVSLSRNDIDWLVTEYSAVCLRGTAMAERAKLIISVAHPDFREQLTKEALALGIIAE